VEAFTKNKEKRNKMKKKIAINGFGRIGRLAYRSLIEDDELEVVAINDLTTPEDLAYLIKYDTVHGKFDHKIEVQDNTIICDNKSTKIYSCKDASELPWGELGIDLVLECTGAYTKLESAKSHINAGAKHVLISAPGKGEMKTIVYGVNENTLDGSEQIISAASCTTNCLAPVLNVLDKHFGVNSGFMTTVHAYTNDQVNLDVQHKKGYKTRRGRACAENIIPTSTGAANAIGKVIPKLDGKLLGSALRVPVSDGSLIDLTLKLDKNTTKEEINQIFTKERSVFLDITTDPIVSSDIKGTHLGALVDAELTEVLDTEDGELIKVVAWYDNEQGYTSQMIRTMKYFLNL